MISPKDLAPFNITRGGQWTLLMICKGDWRYHAEVCIRCELLEFIIVKPIEDIGYTVVDPRDMLQVEVKVVLHAKQD